MHLPFTKYARMSCFLMALALALASIARSEEAKPQQWAILIGVEKYERASPLQFTVNDVKQIANTLVIRAGVPRDHILEITDQRTEPRLQPRKESLIAKLPEWLSKPGEHDSMIVYFSGHGFRDKEGKLYLAPLECDPADPTASGVPVEWFRGQLANCKAAFKLLILDACHAGSEKGEESRSVNANELGAQFEDLDRVVTIASSKADEKSQIWAAKEQSLFSYWLNQGLRGHADQNRGGSVDIDELYEFVSRNVKRTAEARFSRPQTPVRIVRTGIDGVPDVVRIKPQPLKTVLEDVAEQLAYALEERRLGKVGVLEFLNQTPSGDERLGANFGLLGKYCAETLERNLQEQGAGKFSVLDRRRIQEALHKQNFQLASLGSARSLKDLSKNVGGMPVIVVGSLLARQGRFVQLQCKMQQTENDEDLGVTVGGSAALNESEWAMLGRSVVVRPEDRRPEYHDEGEVDSSPETQVLVRVDQRAEGSRSHPLQDPTFPFIVEMLINGQVRKGEFRGNDYFIPVRKGEKYEIRVAGKQDSPVLMKLLIDGLNTLPEKEKVKGVITEEWGSHVNLSEARAWVLDPKDPRLKGGPAVWTVAGFATTTGASGKWRSFEIVDAEKSLAARQNFSDEIGLITVAFYAAASGSRGGSGALGTQAGSEVGVDLTERSGVKVGNLIGVVHLRYVDADALKVTR
ncbi:MAG: caspase family protein [Pirellulaceae bacterium]|nr:caspase family protein [Pirellulaceae bacterium]